MSQAIEWLGEESASAPSSKAPPAIIEDWGLWGLKWGAILLGACVVIGAPFVLHAYVTKKPGTIWAT